MYVKLQTHQKKKKKKKKKKATRSSFSSPNFQSTYIFCNKSETYAIVLSEVVHFIKKTLKASQTAPAFTLSDLKQMFLKGYQRYTGTSIDLHSTRLREILISKIPRFEKK